MEIPDSGEEDLRYLKHLYISLGKLVTASTKEKPTTLLVEEFLYYTETRVPLLIEWMETQITFTRKRNDEMILTREANIPSDIRILVGAWELLKRIVTDGQFSLLKSMWKIFSHFGVKDDEHDQYSWHLSAIIFHWIKVGISDGVIPPNPYRNPYVLRIWGSDTTVIEDDDAIENTRIQGVCLQLKALQCFLNFTAGDGNALLHHKVKKLKKPVYLFRLSATIPGAIVLQFIVPDTENNNTKRHVVMNLRIDANTMGDNYNFFMSPLQYTMACETYIAKYITASTNQHSMSMVQIQPSTKEMVGMTNGYVRYFDTRAAKTMIPLKSKYIY